jgi:hemoglobin-like flavoprotein
VTPEQLEIVSETADRLEAEPRRFADTFYNRLFELAPQVRELFPEDLDVQKAKLVDEVTYLASAAGDLRGFVARAGALGARHHGYGVHVADYDAVEQALLAAVGEVLGVDPEHESIVAWRKLYRLIAETMIAGATDELYTIT